jgi:hypothetical protein
MVINTTYHPYQNSYQYPLHPHQNSCYLDLPGLHRTQDFQGGLEHAQLYQRFQYWSWSSSVLAEEIRLKIMRI